MAAAVSAVTANMLTDWGALVLGSGPEPSRITENGPPSRLGITTILGTVMIQRLPKVFTPF